MLVCHGVLSRQFDFIKEVYQAIQRLPRKAGCPFGIGWMFCFLMDGLSSFEVLLNKAGSTQWFQYELRRLKLEFHLSDESVNCIASLIEGRRAGAVHLLAQSGRIRWGADQQTAASWIRLFR